MTLERLTELREYLQGDKFHCGDDLDGYVNVQDVLNRLDLIDEEINNDSRNS